MGDGEKLLVVDDDRASRKLLKDILTQHGYRVSTAKGGEEALRILETEQHNLILLDIMMPGIDGLEVLEGIKVREDKYLPVIMVTSLGEREHRIKGLELGADEYLSKPIDRIELLTRVKNLLRIKKLNDRLRNTLEQLKDLEGARQELADMLIHDMGNILTRARGFLSMLKIDSPDMGEDGRIDLEKAMGNLDELLRMISNLGDISRMEEGKLTVNFENIDILELIGEVVRDMTPIARKQDKGITIKETGEKIEIAGDMDLLKRTVENLLGNALKFTRESTKVELGISLGDKEVEVDIADRGPGIPRELRDKIFEKFAQVDLKRSGYRIGKGLGLTFCKMAADLHHGSIGVKSRLGGGSIFSLHLPISQE